jgi:hypothetical protein
MPTGFTHTVHGYTLSTRSWPEIVSFYEGLVQRQEKHGYPSFHPMLYLVQQIANSPYAAGLFPATSHSTLRLVQTPEFYLNQERLEINFHPAKRQFFFELQEMPRRSAHPRCRQLAPMKLSAESWKRTYSSEDGFAALVRFIKAKRWFVEYGVMSKQAG